MQITRGHYAGRQLRDTASRPVGPEPEDELEAPSDPGEHIHLPPPTIWPVTVAAGVALAGFGLVTTRGRLHRRSVW